MPVLIIDSKAENELEDKKSVDGGLSQQTEEAKQKADADKKKAEEEKQKAEAEEKKRLEEEKERQKQEEKEREEQEKYASSVAGRLELLAKQKSAKLSELEALKQSQLDISTSICQLYQKICEVRLLFFSLLTCRSTRRNKRLKKNKLKQRKKRITKKLKVCSKVTPKFTI